MSGKPTESLSVGGVSIEEYIALVERCAREKLNYAIANGNAVHARILIAKLFEVAQRRVQIISGTLCQVRSEDGIAIYAHDPVVERACGFLRRPNSTLDIVLQRGRLDQESKNRFLVELSADDQRAGQINLYVPHEDLLGDDVAHMMVSDGTAYRMETGQDAKPANSGIVAFANFGDFKLSKSLMGYFDKLVDYLKTDDHLVKAITLQPGQRFAY